MRRQNISVPLPPIPPIPCAIPVPVPVAVAPLPTLVISLVVTPAVAPTVALVAALVTRTIRRPADRSARRASTTIIAALRCPHQLAGSRRRAARVWWRASCRPTAAISRDRVAAAAFITHTACRPHAGLHALTLRSLGHTRRAQPAPQPARFPVAHRPAALHIHEDTPPVDLPAVSLPADPGEEGCQRGGPAPQQSDKYAAPGHSYLYAVFMSRSCSYSKNA
jgi:hypothetical protein